jgi:hypothetical protein
MNGVRRSMFGKAVAVACVGSGAVSFVVGVGRASPRRSATSEEVKMPHPIVHAEIRSTAPDATRKFFADLLGWTYPDEGQSRSLVGRVLASESIY